MVEREKESQSNGHLMSFALFLSLSLTLSVRLLGFMTIESTTNLLFSTWSQLGAWCMWYEKLRPTVDLRATNLCLLPIFICLACLMAMHSKMAAK